MRKLIVSNAMSLDGYYTGPDDNVMVLELDPTLTRTTQNGCAQPTRWEAAMRAARFDERERPGPGARQPREHSTATCLAESLQASNYRGRRAKT
jgi:hypothetical protein